MWRSLDVACAASSGCAGLPAALSPCRPGQAPEGPPGKFANGQAAAVRGEQRSTRVHYPQGPEFVPGNGPATLRQARDSPHCAWNRAAPTLNRSSPPVRNPDLLRTRPPRGGLSFEAHLPTQQPQAQEDPRFPWSDADARRPSGAARSPGPWPEASVSLIWRIRDRASFEALARARRHKDGSVTLRFVHDGSADPARVSYAVGKWAGSAVTRNLTRRRLRAAVANMENELISGGLYLFGAESGAGAAPFAALQDAVTTLVRDAGAPR